MTNTDLTIIVPLFNEQDSLPRLKTELDSFITGCKLKTGVLFVNDGSTDNSLVIIKEICAGDTSYQHITLSENMGLSAALKAGIDHIESKYTGYIDADLQTSPADFELLLPFIEDFDLVLGHRHQRNDPFVKRMSSLIANTVRRAILNDGVKDTGCPLKIIKTETAKKIPFFKGMHRFIPALVQSIGGKVKEVPVRHFPRLEGEAKYHLSNRIIQPLVDTFAVYWMKKRIINYTFTDKEYYTLTDKG